MMARDWEDFSRPVANCGHISEGDGLCNHPGNITPECHEGACPLVRDKPTVGEAGPAFVMEVGMRYRDASGNEGTCMQQCGLSWQVVWSDGQDIWHADDGVSYGLLPLRNIVAYADTPRADATEPATVCLVCGGPATSLDYCPHCDLKERDWEDFPRPVANCGHINEGDGLCNHPGNITPECHEGACPMIRGGFPFKLSEPASDEKSPSLGEILCRASNECIGASWPERMWDCLSGHQQECCEQIADAVATAACKAKDAEIAKLQADLAAAKESLEKVENRWDTSVKKISTIYQIAGGPDRDLGEDGDEVEAVQQLKSERDAAIARAEAAEKEAEKFVPSGTYIGYGAGRQQLYKKGE